jgi:RimJ/RimL family protein N-acetyltransferase
LKDPVLQKQDMFNLPDLDSVLRFLEGVVRQDQVSTAYVLQLSSLTDWSDWAQHTILYGIFVDPSRFRAAVPTWAIIADDPSTAMKHDWVFSGFVSLFKVNAYSLTAEYGISLWEHARGLGISKVASALIIRYAMVMPEEGGPVGLGLRKFVYGANVRNVASRGLARSLGVKEEGILRSNDVAERAEGVHGALCHPFQCSWVAMLIGRWRVKAW